MYGLKDIKRQNEQAIADAKYRAAQKLLEDEAIAKWEKIAAERREDEEE